MQWPIWWEWELEITPHLEKRMEDRDFTEIDLRTMLERAQDSHPDVIEGRWVIVTQHRRQPWHVIVEPDPTVQLLVVVTAYPVEGEEMRERYVEVTFRNGKPLAAYVYLPRRAGVRSARTVEAAPGILVDYAASGEPIGLEITAPDHVTAAQVNAVLATLGLDAMAPEDLAPLHTA